MKKEFDRFEKSIVVLFMAAITMAAVFLIHLGIDTAKDKIAVKEEKIEELEQQVLSQHLQLVETSNEQLALDVVYIDNETTSRYLYTILYPNESFEIKKNPHEEDRLYVDYTYAEYEKLIKLLSKDENLRSLTLAVVKRTLIDKLSVPTKKDCSDLITGLKKNGTKTGIDKPTKDVPTPHSSVND